MKLKSKWGLVAGTVLVSGAVMAGAAFAATGSAPGTAAPTATEQKQNVANKLDEAVKSGKLTQAEADVLKQVGDLRQAAMAKVKTDSQAIIDQAVKDGKITQAQADKFAKGRGGFELGEADGFEGHDGGGRHGGKGSEYKNLTPTELKAKLDADVKAGKLTQAKADQILSKAAQPQTK